MPSDSPTASWRPGVAAVYRGSAAIAEHAVDNAIVIRRSMEKSLDRKLARILADPSCRDFILADAKDADMAFGLSAPGRSPEHHAGEARFRTLDEYRQQIREIVAQGLVDIMLMSASTNEVLTINERLFDDSHVTPAVRANDTTDIWLAGGSGRYGQQPSQPFRTATIDHIQCGKVGCAAERAPPRGRPGALFRHLQQRRRSGPPHAGRLQGVPHRGRGEGVPAFSRGLRSERLRSIRRPTWPRSSTTTSSARWPE